MKNFTEPRNLMLHTQNKNTRVSKEWFGQIPTIPNSSTAPGSFVCTSACCYSGNPSWQFILGSNVFCLSWKLVCFRISVEQQQHRLRSYSKMNFWNIFLSLNFFYFFVRSAEDCTTMLGNMFALWLIRLKMNKLQ